MNFFFNDTSIIWLSSTYNIINWSISMCIFQSLNCTIITILLLHNISNQPRRWCSSCEQNVEKHLIKRFIVSRIFINSKFSWFNCCQEECRSYNRQSSINILFPSINIYLSNQCGKQVCIREVHISSMINGVIGISIQDARARIYS